MHRVAYYSLILEKRKQKKNNSFELYTKRNAVKFL